MAAYDTVTSDVAIVRGDGEPLFPGLGSAHGIAWSPDEEWIAEATPSGI